MFKPIATVLLAFSFMSVTFPAPAQAANTLSPATAISKDLESAVNTQVRHELEAGYFYLGIANVFEQQSLFGFAHWYTVQFFEEITHARLLMKFLADKGNEVRLETLQPTSIKSELTAMESANLGLKAEEIQTGRIHSLYEMARTAKAYDLETTMAFFVKEQVQEEASFTDLQQKLKIIGASPEGLLALDRELLARPVPVVQSLPVIGP
ncbi:MAG: ferritin [Proteobacteria bacterium]|nr:ferritin [Pseudomonadota bacterium]